MGFIEELKQFAAKGNAVDMAVGILVGTAFNKIVNSIVSDLLMPPIGVLIGGVDFKDLKWVLTTKEVDGAMVPDAAIRYGLFINNVIEFVIVILAAFVVVKVMNKVIAMRIASIPGLSDAFRK